jgi:hypothetical protein
MAKTVVFVVHGVGDPAPGAAMESLAASLEVEGSGAFECNGPAERYELADRPGGKSSKVRLFPLSMRRARRGGEALVFADVHWGSASRIRAGLLGTLTGLFGVLFGFGRIVRRAALSRPGYWLGTLARASSYLLAGPVLACNIVIAVGTLAYVAYAYAVDGEVHDAYAPWIVGTAAAVMLLAAFGLRRRLRLGLTVWTTVFAGAWIVQAFMWRPGWEAFGLLQLGALQIVFSVMLAMLLAASLLYLARRRDPIANVLYFGAGFPVALWSLVVPLLWTAIVERLPAGKELVEENLEVAIPLAGAQWIAVLAFLVAVVVLAFVRKRRAAAGEPAVPRLLVSRALVLVLCVGTALFAWLYLDIAVRMAVGAERSSPIVDAFRTGPLVEKVTGLAGVTVAALFVYGRRALRVGIDIGADVIHYLPEGGGTTSKSAQAIRHRFTEAYRWVMARERPDRVVVVAHSLGSTIVVDELANVGARDVLLVTMGSPVSHLFQHYFPGDYPEWDDDRWEGLRAAVRVWHNFYRADDFVGLAIKDPENAWEGRVHNRRLAPGGHTGYWTDRAFVGPLAELLTASSQTG